MNKMLQFKDIEEGDQEMDYVNKEYPHIIKYMGSKSNIMDFVLEGINSVKSESRFTIVDLFSGSASLAGALRGQANVLSNDIQSYSCILANVYSRNIETEIDKEVIIDKIKGITRDHYKFLIDEIGFEHSEYYNDMSVDEFNDIEEHQRTLNLIDINEREDYSLFSYTYSGTYWSYDQCIWIDSIRYAAEKCDNAVKDIILASLMYALAYTTVGTGHYAQYRVANDENSKNDMIMYRTRNVWYYFERKLKDLFDYCSNFNPYSKNSSSSSMDYLDFMEKIDNGMIIYADPPYAFVHYSRFYHVLETLVKYDNPEVKYKGRYRTDRHQSPFSIKTKVKDAFRSMFTKVVKGEHSLVLSYSNTGMIELCDLIVVAIEEFLNYPLSEEEYKIVSDSLLSDNEEIDFMHLLFLSKKKELKYDMKIIFNDYKHSTMGRKNDKHREVKEALLIAKYIE